MTQQHLTNMEQQQTAYPSDEMVISGIVALSDTAAQAVLAAYGNEIGGIDAIMRSERRGLAAALRATAESLRPDPGQSYQMGGIRACQNQLRTIAAELEGANG